MDKTYEQIFSETYYDLYTTIKKLAQKIPDQRYFVSENWKNNLVPWSIEKIWQTLLEEMEILSDSTNRGDTDDLYVFKILQQTSGSDCYIFSLKASLVRNKLKYFMATYPTLSFVLIIMYKKYDMEIAGDHLGIINEVTSKKWTNLANSPEDRHQILGYMVKYEQYPDHLLQYAYTEPTIEKLLNVSNIDENFENISRYATYNNNNILLRLLWRHLTIIQRRVIMEYVVCLDELELFMDVVKSVDNLILLDLFMSVIQHSAKRILQFIIDNYKINVISGLTRDSKNILNDTSIYVDYDDIHNLLYNWEPDGSTIKLLSQIVEIPRFDSHNELDLFYLNIKRDGAVLKLLIELGVDMVTNINNYPGLSSSVLLQVLDSNTVTDSIKEFIISKYNINKSILLCTCCKFAQINAVKYLLRSNQFSDEDLYGVLRYSSGRVSNLIMNKLGVKYNIIKVVKNFELKQ